MREDSPLEGTQRPANGPIGAIVLVSQLLVAWCGVGIAWGIPPDAATLLEECARVREAVASGHIDVTVRWYGKDENDLRREGRFEYVFDGKRFRVEDKARRSDVARPTVFDGDRYYEGWLSRAEGGRSKVTMRHNRTRQDTSVHIPARTIGMSISDGQFYTVREILANDKYDCTNALVTEEQGADGTALLKITGCKFADKYPVTYWLSPSQQMNLVRYHGIQDHPQGDQEFTIENDLKLYEGQVWFPEKSVITKRFDGEIARRTEYTVNVATFNHEVDERQFTLEGLKLPPGSLVGPVLDLLGNEHGAYWDGSQLIDEKVWVAQQRDRALQARTVGRGMHWSTLALVVILVSVGAAVSYWFWRRRSWNGVS